MKQQFYESSLSVHPLNAIHTQLAMLTSQIDWVVSNLLSNYEVATHDPNSTSLQAPVWEPFAHCEEIISSPVDIQTSTESLPKSGELERSNTYSHNDALASQRDRGAETRQDLQEPLLTSLDPP